MSKKGKKINIWKTLGKPEDFTEEELKKMAQEIRQSIYKNEVSFTETFLPETKKIKLLIRKEKTDEKKEVTQSTKGPTFGEVIDRFFSWYRVVRKTSTYRGEIKRARILERFFGRGFPFHEISIGKVEEFKVWRLKQGVSKSTINKDLRLLASIINRAVEFNWIPDHPLYRKPFLIRGMKNERIRYLSKEEEERLMHVLSSGKNRVLRDIVIVALNTGMRLGEILNLRWENVDLKNKIILLFPEQTKNGKKTHHSHEQPSLRRDEKMGKRKSTWVSICITQKWK